MRIGEAESCQECAVEGAESIAIEGSVVEWICESAGFFEFESGEHRRKGGE